VIALAAAVFALLYALHIRPEAIDFAWLAIALFFLHFAFEVGLPAIGARRDT
jgi:hypothetical protein